VPVVKYTSTLAEQLLYMSVFNRVLHFSGKLGLLQGSRLTAFELVHDKIPAVLVADSAAASLKSLGRVDAVVVGADRIAANGRCLNFHFLRKLCCGGFVARSLLFS
jgi:hypothetical protein